MFPEVFHYTSIAALKAILQTNELWATSIKHLNDSSELEIIWPMVERMIIEQLDAEFRAFVDGKSELESRLSEIGDSNRVATIDGQMLMPLMRHYFVGGEEGKTDRQPPFVVSFATHSGDSANDEYCSKNGMLSQWRAYGGQEGVAIVFDTRELEELLEKEGQQFEYFPLNFLDVVYYENESLFELFPLLIESLQSFLRHFVAEDRVRALEALEGNLAGELASAAGRLKHRGFREERECRIVIGVVPESMRDGFIAMGGKVTGEFKKIYYRKGMCGSVPYIRLFERLDDDLPIRRVIVGPSRNQKAISKTALDLVEGRDIQVELSETPFVSTS